MEDDETGADEEQHQRMLEEIRAAGRPASSRRPKQVQTESVPESVLNVGPMTDLPGKFTFSKCRLFTSGQQTHRFAYAISLAHRTLCACLLKQCASVAQRHETSPGNCILQGSALACV
jgi:hypothetical protein